MQVIITAKVMHHDRLGALLRGRQVEVPEHQALDWLKRGFAERPEARQSRDRPSTAVGTPSSALPAAQVSLQQTSNSSASGKRRKKAAE